MDNKKIKGNYHLIVKKLENRLETINNNRKIYQKLKMILSMISVFILIFGLWPISLITLFLTIYVSYKEKESYHKYCKLVDKLEGYNSDYSNYLDLKDQKMNNIKEVQKMINEDITYDNIYHGEKNGYKIYSKR